MNDDAQMQELLAHTKLVEKLTNENARLRADYNEERARTDQAVNSLNEQTYHRKMAEAENARLRAVVERFQTTHAELDRATYTEGSAIPAWTAFRAALDALLVLDVSGEAT